jgi:hypothetical protein
VPSTLPVESLLSLQIKILLLGYAWAGGISWR